jgi:hypothetical protein
MRGRYPAGPECVDKVAASPQAKQRTKMILQTVFSGLRVREVCAALSICPQRFQQLREQVLQAAVASMEVQPGGRRRRPAESAEMAALREELAELKLALRLAQVRAEIALAMPRAVASTEAEEPGPVKKNDPAAETAGSIAIVEEVTSTAAAELPIFRTEVNYMATTSAENDMVTDRDAGAASVLQRFREEIQRDEREHLDRLKELIRVQAEAAAKARRRGRTWQRGQRRLEKDIRRQAVACYHDLRRWGYTLDEVAELLGVTPRTLRHWAYDSGPEQQAALPLGRPPARSDVAARQEVLRFLKEEGPGVGVPTVRERFPDLARAELTDLVQRYRHVWSARHHVCLRRLSWLVLGRVWAIDFAEPSLVGASWSLPPIDGRYPYLLAVRDLASGYVLCWLPVTAATAAVTRSLLAVLFGVYGVPLVLKADNGPPFRAQETKDFLKNAGGHFLFSPPYWPRYNGAIETSIGSLKRWTEQHAASQGHAGRWTWADVAAARQQANAGQPRRLHGRTPTDAWASRTAVTDAERVRFELTVLRERYLARSEMGLDQEKQLDHWEDSAVDRKAIERALVEHDYLLFRGRRVPLMVKAGRVTDFV